MKPSFSRDILPVKIDGVVVHHKEELKKYKIGSKNGSTQLNLLSVYQALVGGKYLDGLSTTCSFPEYVDIFCKERKLKNPYTITSANIKSKDFITLARKIITDEDNETLIRYVMQVALSNDRDRMKAIEYWLMWVGANKVAETAQDISDEPINIIPG